MGWGGRGACWECLRRSDTRINTSSLATSHLREVGQVYLSSDIDRSAAHIPRTTQPRATQPRVTPFPSHVSLYATPLDPHPLSMPRGRHGPRLCHPPPSVAPELEVSRGGHQAERQ